MPYTTAVRRQAGTVVLALLGATVGASFSSAAAAGPVMTGWSPTAHMSVARSQHTATLLRGGDVLVTGGSPSPAAEIWRPGSGRWTAAGSMSINRSGATATRLPDGRVLVAGGCTGSHCDSVASSAELYDPTTRSWTLAAPMPTPHAYATATMLASGLVLVAGGCSGRLCGTVSGAAELYDPSTGRWQATGDLQTPRRWHSTVLLPSGQVLVAGGELVRTAELYTPATGRWTYTDAMGTARGRFTLTSLPSGEVLAAGGCAGYYCLTSLATAETYDPATARWTPTAPMRDPRQGHAAALLPSGQVLVAGGSDNRGNPLAKAERYQPASRDWAAAPDMGSARSFPTATTLSDGRVLTAGGGTYSAEVYKP